MAFESVSRFPDYQAEYEGSIPFTRSKQFPGIGFQALASTTWRDSLVRFVDPGRKYHARLSCRLLHHRFQHFGEHAGDGAAAALVSNQQ